MQLRDAEKFEISAQSWSELPRMQHARTAFMPVLYQAQFYLIASAPGLLPIEVFPPLSETYQVLDVSIQGDSYEATSFLVDDEIMIIRYGASALRWRPGQSSYRSFPVSLPDFNCAISATSPKVVRKTVYWTQYMWGHLVKFDLETCTAKYVYTFSE